MSDRVRIALAFLIIIGILFFWTMLNRPTQKPAAPAPTVQDTALEKVKIAEEEFVPAVQETIVVNRQHVKVVLSTYGGSISSYRLNDYDIDIVPPGRNLFVSLRLDSVGKVVEFQHAVFNDSVVFKSAEPGKQIVKTYIFDKDYGFTLRVKSNTEPKILSTKYGLNVTEMKNRPDDLRHFGAYVKGDKVDNISKKIKVEYEPTGKMDWFALRSKYFVMIVNNNSVIDRLLFFKFPDEEPKDKTENAAFGCYGMGGAKERYGVEIVNNADIHITVLLLPINHDQLAQYKKGYEVIASGGFWGPIARIIIIIMNFMYSLIKNYGFAIIIFGLIIKLIFFPLSRQMIMSQHKMQMLQPELKKIQQKYKNEPQRLNQEMMHLYKTYKVNPFTGCLPLLIQMPIFFALFQSLSTAIEFRHASFILWITDLSLKDPYYVLPISMGVMMLIQSLTTTIDPRQRLMVLFMPIFMVWIFLSLPSGLQLYWFTYNILTLGEHFITKRGGLQ
jgi:YidC/Oxa1 family membrane protein insertase